jgi:hypothetical protein
MFDGSCMKSLESWSNAGHAAASRGKQFATAVDRIVRMRQHGFLPRMMNKALSQASTSSAS